MCGISGYISFNSQSPTLIEAMTNVIHHRGPDDEGYVLFSDNSSHPIVLGGPDTSKSCFRSDYPYSPKKLIREASAASVYLALGHRRLSIVDLSSSGHQPMSSADKRHWMVYNGEIYNYIELREELVNCGHGFMSQSDSEVILTAYREWGVEFLSRLNGMFAFLIYDTKDKILLVARDRFGIKPLYYRVTNNGVAFASEIKQFTVLPDWQGKLNGQRIYDFLNWNLVDHTSETCFDDVFQIRGGEHIELNIDKIINNCDGINQTGLPEVKKWYQLKPLQFSGKNDDAVDMFRNLLQDSIRLRLRSDVPVGSCLSGGLDSSSIVCVINSILSGKNNNELQKTFSACSNDIRFDERLFIEQVTAITKVDSKYVFPGVDELIRNMGSISWHQDEPFGSTSIYAQWCVFKLAAENNVKVMLDGQGADELLAGYKIFFASRYANLFKQGRLMALWREARAARKYYGNSELLALQYIAYILLPNNIRRNLMQLTGREQLEPNWINMSAIDAQPINPFITLGNKTDSIQELSYAQIISTNLPMLLHWEDRNSMAHSIEARVPFLDYRLVEFVLGLPDEYKISGGITKRILRGAMNGILPEKVQNRKDKMGFVTAEQEWMTKQKPDFFKKNIQETIDMSSGILTNKAQEQAFSVIDNARPFSHLPWRIISLGAWLKKYDIKTS